ncbi:hypothetical protein MNO14_09655 [Luteimonas sp. S4-F44]|uniref:hypothetical protein n=1 Tax=Luteimonas sp. S4-F44 TaxID=2925842 RepID=UPI001F53233F|nr:hypothetical protein [Luteimonas sp. S4-F44]UNK41250.1 hypothetical protein MNO14_09655 [Luteimonas sp. S4-F44]
MLFAALCASIFSLGSVAAAPVEPAAGEPMPLRDARLVEGMVAGTSQGEWTVRWWRWAMGKWIAPYLDPDGRWCAMGQDPDSPVWFLAGTGGSFTPKRRCVVPEGKYLLVPVINTYFQGSGAVEEEVCAPAQGWVAVNNDQLAARWRCSMVGPLAMSGHCVCPATVASSSIPTRHPRCRPPMAIG